MKTLSAALQAHLDGELTTLAYLVKITRLDGTVLGFTTTDQTLAIGGVAYLADSAFTPSAVASTSGLATDNLEITGMLDSGVITSADIEAGLYDQARVDFYACNWADLTQGTIQLRRGWIGEITEAGGHYVAELRGLRDLLQRPVGAYYTAECRFDLGDANCTIDLAALTATGSVTAVTDNETFGDAAQTAATGAFAYGKLTWTSGANAGLAMDVKGWDAPSQTFTLWLPMPAAIEIGDAYSVTPGCDKRFTTCQTRFNNVPNFGGFPYVPGVGNILKYPDMS